MIVETFAAGPLGCNCSILGDEVSRRAIVVDPGGDFDQIEARLAKHGLVTEAIVHTHTHIDHVGATAQLQRKAGASARIHEGDAFLYSILPVQASMLGMGAPPETAELDTFLRDDDVIRAGAIELRVLHTPGHTPGSCCFELRNGESGILFAGDTLFRSSIGRTDLWGGDHDLILKSIRGKVYSLDETTRVVCGHGPDTTIAAEKRNNPFVRALSIRAVCSLHQANRQASKAAKPEIKVSGSCPSWRPRRLGGCSRGTSAFLETDTGDLTNLPFFGAVAAADALAFAAAFFCSLPALSCFFALSLAFGDLSPM